MTMFGNPQNSIYIERVTARFWDLGFELRLRVSHGEWEKANISAQ